MSKIIIIIDNITKRAGTERAVVNLSNILAKQAIVSNFVRNFVPEKSHKSIMLH